MNYDELLLALDEGEGYKIEFKESPAGLDREMVAFANSSGGKIIIGVADDGKIKGISITNRLKSQVQDIANNCDPPVPVSLKVLNDVLIVDVDEGPDKPHSCKEGFFIRVGPNSQKLKRDEIIEYFTHEGKIRFDEQFCPDFRYPEDFSRERFHEYLKRCNITRNLPDKQTLTNLGLMQKQKGKLFLNNAAVLLFAKEPTRFHFHAVITCVRFKGRTKTDIIDRKDFNDDLISNVNSAMKWLTTYVPLRYEITGKSLERNEIPEIPYDVLREALLNAAIHRDYFERGGMVTVEFYDDRITIQNPGGLVKGIKPEDFGTVSISRNPFLQGLFHRAHLVERIGSGIGRMMERMRAAGLEEPAFTWNGIFRFEIERPLPKEVIERLTKSLTKSLTKLDIVILKAAQEPVPLAELAAKAGFSHKSFFKKKHLNHLLDAGLLAMTVPDKPRSSQQRYVMTVAGKKRLGEGGK